MRNKSNYVVFMTSLNTLSAIIKRLRKDFCIFRALHMKEHPDYKYRPRRKPKTLIKTPNQGSQSNGNQHQNNNNNNNLHSNHSHHHAVKHSSSSSPIMSNLHHQHINNSTGKYPFVSTIELPISFSSSQQQQNMVSTLVYHLLEIHTFYFIINYYFLILIIIFIILWKSNIWLKFVKINTDRLYLNHLQSQSKIYLHQDFQHWLVFIIPLLIQHWLWICKLDYKRCMREFIIHGDTLVAAHWFLVNSHQFLHQRTSAWKIHLLRH